eukprot:jgi/Undpi1/2669/HiC_scaffold_13.g06047.m1
MAGLGNATPSYPGVAELTRQLDQEKIAMLSKRVDDLRNQNQDLKNKIFKSENDTHEFVAYFEKEMEAKDDVISKLNDELIRKESEMRVAVKKLQEKAQNELTELSDQMNTKENQLTAQIKHLEGDLLALVRFRELRDAHNKAMEDMAATVEAKELVHVQAMNNLERKLLIDKGNMQKDLERVIEEAKRQAKIEAHSNLSSETKRIAGDNKRMAKELRFQMQMTTELQAHSKALEEHTTNTARDVAILKDKDQEYARQGQAKSKELKLLRGQVSALTKALLQEAVKTKKEGEKTRQEVARELEEQALDGAGLRQLLALKNRELRHLRKLSQYILEQRNEVETFFLEALEEVKRRIVNGRQEKYRRAVVEYNKRVRDSSRNRTKFPKIRDVTALDPGPPSSLPTDPNTKVDIASLTWEDKERVLRLLFAKINNVQGYVEATPEHPLEAASAAAYAPSPTNNGGYGDFKAQGDETFVTQATGGGIIEEGRRSSLELLAEREPEVGGGVRGS